MEEDFKRVIENIKEETVDPVETKRYMLKIKKLFKDAFEICKDEYSESEVLEMCLKEYNKDRAFRGNAQDIYYDMRIYDTYKELLFEYKKNKSKFTEIVNEAKRIEQEKKKESIGYCLNRKEMMISAIRYIIRNFKTTNQNEILRYIKENKNIVSKKLRNNMVKIIQTSVGTLEEYEIIDEYINVSNEELEQVGLGELKLDKRNPIADEHYYNGELVEDVEDIGVIDTFFTENLNKMSIEDLEIMTIFYESKYLQERIGISKAMNTIKMLNLWDNIFKGENKDIEDLDNNIIKSTLKRDLALTYLCRDNVEITPKIKKQYKKFLEENNINLDTELEDDIKESEAEVSNLSCAARDIGIFECLLMHQLREKQLKIKKWGVIKDNKKIIEGLDKENILTIAIENQNFRGPLIMDVSKEILSEFFNEEDIYFPEYKGNLNEDYCKIMSRLYLPTNKFFTKNIKKLYEENPQSEVLANLAGKKVKEER